MVYEFVCILIVGREIIRYSSINNPYAFLLCFNSVVYFQNAHCRILGVNVGKKCIITVRKFTFSVVGF